MANAEARLRLVVEAIDRSSAVFSTILAQARTVGAQIGAALNAGMAAGNGGGAGKGKSNDPFHGIQATVTKTRGDLENFYTFYAEQVGRIGSVPLAKNLSDVDLAKFHGDLMGVNTQLKSTSGHFDSINRLLAFQNLSIASQQLKTFGEDIAGFLQLGIERAMEFQETSLDLANALKTNLDPSIQDFDTNANALRTDLSLLSGVMDKMGKKAFEIGVRSKFTDEQILASMKQLAASGISADDILNGAAEAAATLAQATGTDLMQSTKIITSTWHSMGKTLRDEFGNNTTKAIGSIGDTLTNLRLTTGEDLTAIGNTIKYVGPIADEFGIKFGDLGTAVAVLGRAGVQGSMAGTALRRMLTNLTPQTDAAKEAMTQLGIITADGTNRFFDQDGSIKSLAEVQKILYESTNGLSDANRVLAMKTIFGQYALQSMLKIAGTSPAAFEDLATKVNQAGTAFAASEAWLGTTAGQLDVLNENLDQARKLMGEGLLPVINDLIAQGKKLTQWFLDLSPQVQALTGYVLGITAALLITVGTIGAVVAAFGLFMTGLAAAGISLSAIAVTVGTVILVVAAIAAGVYLLYKAWDSNFAGIQDVTKKVMDFVGPYFFKAMLAIKDAVIDAIGAIVDWWHKFYPVFEKAITNIITFIETYIAPTLKILWEGIANVISSVWDGIVLVLKGAFKIITGVFDIFAGLFAGDWDTFWGGIGKVVDGFFTILEGVITAIGGAVVKMAAWLIKAALEAGLSLSDMVAKGITEGLKWVVEAVKSVAKAIWSYLGFSSPTEEGPGSTADKWMPNLMGMLADGILAGLSRIKNAVGMITGAVSGAFEGLVSSAVSWGTSIVSGISSAISTARSMISSISGEAAAAQSAAAAAQTAWSAAKTRKAEAETAAKKVVTEPVKAVIQQTNDFLDASGANMVETFTKSIETAKPAVTQSVQDIMKTVHGYIGFESPTELGPGRNADKWGVNLVHTMVDGITAGRGLLRNAMQGVAGDLAGGFGGSSVAGAGGARGGNVTININMIGTGNNRNDAENLAGEVRKAMATVTSRF